MDLLEALARSKNEDKDSASSNPFLDLYDAHPELELERTSLSDVSSNNEMVYQLITNTMSSDWARKWGMYDQCQMKWFLNAKSCWLYLESHLLPVPWRLRLNVVSWIC